MKTINDYQHPSLDNLENERQHWHLIDPQLQNRRLNRWLKRRDIQQTYIEAALAFASIERWECLEWNDFSRFPSWRLQLREVFSYLLPRDVEQGDWCFICIWKGSASAVPFVPLMSACHLLGLMNASSLTQMPST